MRSQLAWSVLLIALLPGCCVQSPLAPPPLVPIPPDAIQTEIEWLQHDLLMHQSDWLPQFAPANDPASLQRTAWVTYALLIADDSPDDPHIQRALAILQAAKPTDTQTRMLRLKVWLLAWEQTHDKNFQNLADADATALIRQSVQEQPNGGGPDDFATVAGLSAVVQMGGEVPDKVWLMLDRRIRNAQLPDGAWPTRTTAGVSALLAIRSIVAANSGLACNGNFVDGNVDNGIEWISKHLDLFKTPNDYLALEQVAQATGRRYFGKTDWFAEFSDRILHDDNLIGEADPIRADATKLLFLVNGSAPVIFTKLDYSRRLLPGSNWNERPSDIRNLTDWIGRESEANLNWQIADLASPLDDWHDSPILYLAGKGRIHLFGEDIAKLRAFVLEGGMIVGNADCNDAAFDQSFQQLGEKMFPEYQFRELSPDHLIYSGELYRASKLRGRQPIFGLSNGVRELMLLLPTGDPARYWQLNAWAIRVESFEIGADIVGYATDMFRLRNKGDSCIVRPDFSVTPTRTIAVARLMVGANPDPEPGGWLRLASIMHNTPFKVDLRVDPVWPGESLAGYQIVHITGTTAFKLTPAERRALVDFAAHGGTLIIDAAGGSTDFADSAESELRIMFGNGAGNTLTWLPPGSLLYTLPQAPISRIGYRRFARRNLVGDVHAPHIQAVIAGGRCVAFFSREDLSAGLVGEDVDGIIGYSPQTATELMRNMILYAAMSK